MTCYLSLRGEQAGLSMQAQLRGKAVRRNTPVWSEDEEALNLAGSIAAALGPGSHTALLPLRRSLWLLDAAARIGAPHQVREPFVGLRNGPLNGAHIGNSTAVAQPQYRGRLFHTFHPTH